METQMLNQNRKSPPENSEIPGRCSDPPRWEENFSGATLKFRTLIYGKLFILPI